MGEPQRYESEWEGMRLVVEARSDYWRVYVCEPAGFEILYSAERLELEAAKSAGVDFIATTVFGARHDLKPAVIAEMLVWDTA